MTSGQWVQDAKRQKTAASGSAAQDIRAPARSRSISPCSSNLVGDVPSSPQSSGDDSAAEPSPTSDGHDAGLMVMTRVDGRFAELQRRSPAPSPERRGKSPPPGPHTPPTNLANRESQEWNGWEERMGGEKEWEEEWNGWQGRRSGTERSEEQWQPDPEDEDNQWGPWGTSAWEHGSWQVAAVWTWMPGGARDFSTPYGWTKNGWTEN